MPETPMPRSRRSKILQALLGICLIGMAIWAAWFLTGPRFHDFMRTRVVSRLEKMTGGRVEMSALRWNLSRMEFEADDLTIHGKEKPGEPPYVHVDRLFARAKVLSVFRREVDLQFLSVTRPSVHIIVYPDGTTNQPEPKVRSNKNGIQSLVELAIGKLQLQQGELLVNEQRVPLDLDANDVAIGMSFDPLAKRYDGVLHVGRAETKLKDWRPLAFHGDTEFSLFADHAEIKSLRAASGASTVEASGNVQDFRNPAASLSYKAHIDVREMATIGRNREFDSGMMDLQGKGAWSLQRFTSNGSLHAHALEYRNRTVHIKDADIEASYSIEPQRILLPKIVAQLWQGTVSGRAEINDGFLLKEGKAPVQVGFADLRLENVQLAQIAVAVTSKRLPFDDLHLTGNANGTARLDWHGSMANATAKLAIEVSPNQAAPRDGELPVTASLRGTYLVGSETLMIDHLRAQTPATNISAAGSIGSVRAQLRLDVHSARVAEFAPLIDAIRGPDASEFRMNGSGTFTGTVSGRLRMPTIVGGVSVQDFTMAMPVQGSAPGAPKNAHWDSLSGQLRYTPDQFSIVNATLARGDAQIGVDFTSVMQQGKFNDALPFTVRANVRRAEIIDLLGLAGYKYPVSGRMDAVLSLSGTQSALSGRGRIQIEDAVVYGEPVRKAVADIEFSNSEAQFRNVRLSSAAGEVFGEGAVNVKSSAFRFDLQSAGLQLGSIQSLRSRRIDLQGGATFRATGKGTPDRPLINGKINFSKLVVGGEPLGALDVDAITVGDELQLKGRSNFSNALLELDGKLLFRDQLPASFNVNFRNLDVDSIVRGYLSQLRITSHTLLNGRAELEGPLRQPKLLKASATVDTFTAGVENMKVSNEGPIHLALSNGVVSIESLHLVGEGTNFTASGTIDALGDHAIDLSARGRLNLRVLQSFSPEYTSSGFTTLSMTVGGTFAKPQLRGTIEIEKGAISYVDLPNGLSGINGTLVFTEDRLQVKKLTARTGGGDLNLGGFIAYKNGLSFNLTAKGSDIRLRYPPGVSASGDADLTLAGTPKNSLLSGEITVTRFGLSPRFDFASYIAQTKQPIAPVKPDSPVNGLRLDIHVVSTPELQLETSLAKVTGNLDLHLRGTGARPVVLGRVNILEGDLVFNSTKYHLERGELTFTNPARIEPVIDMEASAHVRDYDITLGFHGPTDRLSTTYRSDPPLPTADIIALLALGRTREESAQAQMYNPQQTTITDSASNALLSQALNATVSSRVQKLFGVSRIKIDPQVGGPENNANARLTIEQQVSNNITLTYITNLSQSAQQIIQVEYNITRDISILAVRDQTGVLGFDVRVRQRKK